MIVALYQVDQSTGLKASVASNVADLADMVDPSEYQDLADTLLIEGFAMVGGGAAPLFLLEARDT